MADRGRAALRPIAVGGAAIEVLKPPPHDALLGLQLQTKQIIRKEDQCQSGG